ncbi:MAG: Trk system potassium uptake protein TrkA [Alphaproteobacteria bacterium MarineAlpha6_Bin6]|nr:Trk system potassium transporter TrkA [Pelagibacteraceae bacterium]PPR30441.1 MAG: Trk system potassium uptake protein TrkA [Alphaproteobacteria bacterium MarineAlpha6_Bin6]PPR32996.1 MAG: Trk system potassium uptake protein TrkA [Alphaproteobacteria bacterium MarineAlpha6_Bin5]|tara:strand:+ start:11063 stop:12442 length:1380 start_codon:yes stop_codon:yes gene_type:complete
MKVIICGAGEVGKTLAQHLSKENNDITIIDQSEENLKEINEHLDVNTYVGYGSQPGILDKAGAKDAEMLIAVTQSDEVNMIACEVANSQFNVPLKVARIRDQHYLDPNYETLFSKNQISVDLIISPETEVAEAIRRRLIAPGAFEIIPFSDKKIVLLGIKIEKSCPHINKQLLKIEDSLDDLKMNFLTIFRKEKIIMANSNEKIKLGDSIYVLADTNDLHKVMTFFGHKETKANSVIIVGGGNIGVSLAKRLEESKFGANTKLIELNKERAENISANLNDTLVINGSSLDPEILQEAKISEAETIISVTNQDEVNILTSLLAKKQGCTKAISLANDTTYRSILEPLGIDDVLSPQAITVSRILSYIRKGSIRQVYSLREGEGEVIEADAVEASSVVNKKISELKLPNGVKIGAVLKNENDVHIPNPNLQINEGDRVILFSLSKMIKKVENLLSVRFRFY